VVLDETYAQNNADVRPGAYVMIAVTDTARACRPRSATRYSSVLTTKEPAKGPDWD